MHFEIQGKLSTSSSNVTLLTIPIPLNSSGTIEIIGVARDTGSGGRTFSRSITATFERDGGNASIVGNRTLANILNILILAPSLSVTTSGGNAIIQSNSGTTATFKWSAKCKVLYTRN